VQAEIRQTETKRGDFLTPFDPSASAPVRLNGRVQSGRIGADHSLSSSSDVLFSAVYQTRDLDLTFPSFDNARTTLKDRSYSGELQWYYRSRPFYVVAGAGYLKGSEEFVGILKQDISAHNVYVYGELEAESLRLKLQGGLSANYLDETPLRKTRTDPKLGLIWAPTADTTVRAAAMRTLKRPLIANQTLEPTQMAGFNQFFDLPDGTEDTRYGVALDQRVLRNGHVGFDVSRSRMTVPVLSTDSVTEFDWHDRTAKAYVYWTLPGNQERTGLSNCSAAIAVQYEFDKMTRPEELPGDEGIVSLDTRLLPIRLTLFPAEQLALQVTSTYVRQTGRLQAGVGFDSFDVNQRFWITDFSVNYRILAPRGILALGVSNLFDRKVDGFQELDKSNPRFALGRLAFVRLTLQF